MPGAAPAPGGGISLLLPAAVLLAQAAKGSPLGGGNVVKALGRAVKFCSFGVANETIAH